GACVNRKLIRYKRGAWVNNCFFFSSRRRHTRLVSDWSSDVCSSDLDGIDHDGRWTIRLAVTVTEDEITFDFSESDEQAAGFVNRSEERRVGKECRSRGAGCH